jgi:hypothetical protein
VKTTRTVSALLPADRLQQGAMEENHELADLIGRLGPGQELADELLRRWLDDPDAAPQWQRLAEDVRVDEPLD